jgi:hypothetical protein
MVIPPESLMDCTVGSMRAGRIFTVMAAVVATAAMALGATPSEAQAPAPRPHHPPVRVTVHKRPSVDPVIENRRRNEYYDVFSLEYGMAPRRNSTLFQNGPSLPFIHDRMPFPTCLDLPGFCRTP